MHRISRARLVVGKFQPNSLVDSSLGRSFVNQQFMKSLPEKQNTWMI